MLVDVTNGLSERSGNSGEIRFEKHFVMFCEAFGTFSFVKFLNTYSIHTIMLRCTSEARLNEISRQLC